jgi:hypothetical protein
VANKTLIAEMPAVAILLIMKGTQTFRSLQKLFVPFFICLLIAGCRIQQRRYLPGFHVEMHNLRLQDLGQPNKNDFTKKRDHLDELNTIQTKNKTLFLTEHDSLRVAKKIETCAVVHTDITIKPLLKPEAKADSTDKHPKSALQITAISLATGAAFAANQLILDAVFRSIASATGFGIFNGLGVFSLGLSALTITLILSTMVAIGVLIYLVLSNRKIKGKKSQE